MIDLPLRLVDRIIELLKRREQVDRALYTDFVAPTFADFEAVHMDYLDSFRRYRDLMKGTQGFFSEEHPVFETIRNDNLFSENLRAKVRSLYVMENATNIEGFIVAIRDYLDLEVILDGVPPIPVAIVEPPAREYLFQFARTDLYRGLAYLAMNPAPDAEKRRSALEMINLVAAEMQRRYGKVVHEHTSLRKLLLEAK